MSTDKQKTIKKMDKVFSLYIRKRDTYHGAGQCCSCKKIIMYEDGDAGHFINRRFMSTRWHEKNVHLQCRSCNRFEEGNGAGYALFMIDKYGREQIEYLQAISRETAKYTVPEIELMIAEYKAKL